MQKTIELPAGTLHYAEFGPRDGEPVVFVHGFAVDGRLWEPAARLLAERGLRCVVPTWPFGSHRTPMNPGTDLTPPAAARLVGDFLEALDLDGVTLVGNDSGGAVTQLLVTSDPSRIGRLVLTNCDSFENFPPGIFKPLGKAAKLPGSGWVLAQSMRFEPFIRSPFGFGSVNAERQPIELLRSFLRPLIHDRAVRRDALTFFAGADARDTLAAAAKLPDLDLPALLVWGTEDTLFPVSDAERLRDTLADATLVLVPGAKTLVPLDRPDAVAAAIGEFIDARPTSRTSR